MKYLKNFYFMIKESVETYDIKSEVNENNFVIKYEFNDDDGNRFMVQFKNDTIGPKSKPMLGNSYELTWYVWDNEIENWSFTKVVNSNVWKILQLSYTKN
jgi:hypothetical protein